jgi:hypothetical protein
MEETITASQLTRELLERCIKAEVALQVRTRLSILCYRAMRDALRAKSQEKSRAALVAAIDAYDMIDYSV